MRTSTPSRSTAVAGDVAVLVGLTVHGFVNHAEVDAVRRLLVTTVAFLLAWFVVAPWLDVFGTATLTDPRRVWRVAWAWAIAAPAGALLRSLFLGRTIVVVLFVLVIVAVDGLGLVVWRGALAWWNGRRRGEAPPRS